MGSIDLRQAFDTVLLVLLDSDFNAFAMYEASRAQVGAALSIPGSKARNERGALAIKQFMAIGAVRWVREQEAPIEDTDAWPETSTERKRCRGSGRINHPAPALGGGVL
jgi:hypothetical protein